MVLFAISNIIYKIQLMKLIIRNFIKLFLIQEQFKIWLPYLPVYNAHPCIIRTPILDCTLEKKKEQKTEELVIFKKITVFTRV